MPAQSRGRVLAPRRRAGALRRVQSTPQPRFDVVESKLRVPIPRPGVVSRTALVNRLRVTHSFPVATLTAPAGYGKTTLLTQWSARDKRARMRFGDTETSFGVATRELLEADGLVDVGRDVPSADQS